MLWHQSLKSIHYRTLLIFQNKKKNKFEGQNMGGMKDMLSPPCQNTGGIHHHHPPIPHSPIPPSPYPPIHFPGGWGRTSTRAHYPHPPHTSGARASNMYV